MRNTWMYAGTTWLQCDVAVHSLRDSHDGAWKIISVCSSKSLHHWSCYLTIEGEWIPLRSGSQRETGILSSLRLTCMAGLLWSRRDCAFVWSVVEEEYNDLPRCVCCFQFELAGMEFQDAWHDFFIPQDQVLVIATQSRIWVSIYWAALWASGRSKRALCRFVGDIMCLRKMNWRQPYKIPRFLLRILRVPCPDPPTQASWCTHRVNSPECYHSSSWRKSLRSVWK